MENKVIAICEGLNSEQKGAVECMDGPVLIVAGAGSGKTRVLTSRVANILAHGCEPDRILALTFTRKAAGEMKDRIAQMVGERKARRVCMGTFHSVFIRFLREYADVLGYPSSFTIYDTGDSVSAIKTCVKELQLDEKVYKPKEVLSRISMAKNNLVTDSAYRSNPNIIASDTKSRKPRICDIYTRYSQVCRQAGVMDFDDILLNMNILLRDFPAACEAIAQKFSYILVDEYQDTNYAQYIILKRLAQWHHNICVVGDDSQSIYAFRGAKIENILNFRKDYPGCRTFRLERNYRSTRVIVEAANSLIAKNSNRIPKECYSEAAEGEKIRLLRAFNEQEEAVLITNGIIDRMREEKAQYQDFAVLYRTNSQSRALEEALRKRNLPYVIYSGHSFFERAEVKDLMAWFKLVVNPRDNESFRRAVGKPSRGIGDTSLDALSRAADSLGVSLFEAAGAELDKFGLKAAAASRIRSFCDLVSRLGAGVATEDALTLSRRIGDESGLYQFYREDNSIEGMARLANVDELLNSVSSFVEDRQNEAIAEMEAQGLPIEETALPLVRLDEFLENISLLSTVDLESEEDTNNKIALMTVHSAKGLEFPYVYVAGMEENLFPSGGMLASPVDIEEERRLFYVAITRACKTVAISFAQTRMRNGKHESNPPSRFLSEIESRYFANPLRQQDFEISDDSDDSAGGFSFGSRFGSRFGQASSRSGSGRSHFGSGQTGSRSGGSPYGRSGPVYQERGTASRSGYERPSGSSSSHTESFGRGTSSAVRPSSVSGRPFSGQPVSTAASDRPLSSAPSAPPERYTDFVPSPMSDFSIGKRIEHIRFGPGLILDLNGRAPEIKAKIKFDEYAEPKTILLKYAKMRLEQK